MTATRVAADTCGCVIVAICCGRWVTVAAVDTVVWSVDWACCCCYKKCISTLAIDVLAIIGMQFILVDFIDLKRQENLYAYHLQNFTLVLGIGQNFIVSIPFVKQTDHQLIIDLYSFLF